LFASFKTADPLEDDPDPVKTAAFHAQVQVLMQYILSNTFEFNAQEVMQNVRRVPTYDVGLLYAATFVALCQVMACIELMHKQELEAMLDVVCEEYDRCIEEWKRVRYGDGELMQGTSHGVTEISNFGNIRVKKTSGGIKWTKKFKGVPQIKMKHEVPTNFEDREHYFDKRVEVGGTSHSLYQWNGYAHKNPMLSPPTHIQVLKDGPYIKCGAMCHLTGNHSNSNSWELGKTKSRRSCNCYLCCAIITYFFLNFMIL